MTLPDDRTTAEVRERVATVAFILHVTRNLTDLPIRHAYTELAQIIHDGKAREWYERQTGDVNDGRR